MANTNDWIYTGETETSGHVNFKWAKDEEL